MPKNNRVELRLNDEDYQRLRERAEYFRTSMTGAVESLLCIGLPAEVWGVREVGVRGRRRLTVGFSNGMVVHGFLWSRGGQLLTPSIPNEYGRGRIRIVDGTREFWQLLRRFLTEQLGVDNEPAADAGADGEVTDLVDFASL